MQVTAESEIGNDIQRQQSERSISIDSFVLFGTRLKPAIEIGKMFLHHFTHSKEILLGENMDEILASYRSGITSVAIGDTEHELVTRQFPITFVEMRFDLFLAVNEFDVLNVRSHDEVGGDTNHRT
jgi:hypothetical protein